SVALCGAGADEGFAGAPRHLSGRRDALLRGLLPGPVRAALRGSLTRLPRIGAGLAGRLTSDGAEAYATGIMVTPPVLRAQLWREEATVALHGYRPEERYIAAMRAAPAREFLDRIQYADIHIALPA